MGFVSGAPTTRPPTPPTAGGYASGSLRRPVSNSSSISSPYRTPAPQFQVQQVQSGNYAPGMYGGQQPLVQQVSMTGPGGVLRTSGYAPGSSAMMRLPPVVPPGHFHLQHQGSRTSTHSYVMDPNLINHANIHQPIGNGIYMHLFYFYAKSFILTTSNSIISYKSYDSITISNNGSLECSFSSSDEHFEIFVVF